VQIVTTNKKWAGHLSALVLWGLVVRERVGRIRHFSTFFGVLKSACTPRAIFNGRRLSMRFLVPPPGNLLDPYRLLTVISKILRGRKCWITSCDFRHFFHQIPVDPAVSAWFGVSWFLDGVRCVGRWAALPMGWSYSPFIAQSIGLQLLLECCAMTFGNEVTKPYDALKSPPPYIHLQVEGEVSFIAHWYDNVLLVCSSPVHHEKFVADFRNIAKKYTLVIKELDSYSPKQLAGAEELEKPPVYLGLELGLKNQG